MSICEVFRLSDLSHMLQCWRCTLQRGWCALLRIEERIEDLLSFAQVVLKTSNHVVIPRCRFVDVDTYTKVRAVPTAR